MEEKGQGLSPCPFYFKMKIPFKKIVTVIVLMSFLNAYAVRPAYSWLHYLAPIAMAGVAVSRYLQSPAVQELRNPAIYSAAGHAIVGLLFGTYYYAGSGPGSKAYNEGVAMQARAVWTDMTGPGGTPKLNSQDLVSLTTLQSLNSAADANPSLASEFNKSRTTTTPGGLVTDGYVAISSKDGVKYKYTSYGSGSRSFPNLDGTPPAAFVGNFFGNSGDLTVWSGLALTLDSSSWFQTWTSYYGTVTTDPVTPDSGGTAPSTPSQQASALNSNPAALAQLPALVAATSGGTKLINTSNPVNAIGSPEASINPATPSQVAAADSKEYQAQLSSLQDSATAAQTVASASPTAANLKDASDWKSAFNALSAGGTGSMLPGFPISSGSGSFPKYNGSAGVPSTGVAPVVPSSGGTNNSPGTDSSTIIGDVSANHYDSYGDSDKPQKSDLKALIKGFIDTSPLVALVRKLSVTTTSSVSSLSFQFHGQTIAVDFGRYGDFLRFAGSAFLSLSHMYALYIVFRRND